MIVPDTPVSMSHDQWCNSAEAFRATPRNYQVDVGSGATFDRDLKKA